MNPLEIVLIAVLAAAAIGAVIWLIRRRGAGCCGCGSCQRSRNCAGCEKAAGEEKNTRGEIPKEKKS